MKVREFLLKAKATHFAIGSFSGYMVIAEPENIIKECERVSKEYVDFYRKKYDEAVDVIINSADYREKHERLAETWREKSKFFRRKGDLEKAERCRIASEREKRIAIRTDERLMAYKKQKEKMKNLLAEWVDIQDREIRDKFNSLLRHSDIMIIVPGDEMGRWLYVEEWEKEQKNAKDE